MTAIFLFEARADMGLLRINLQNYCDFKPKLSVNFHDIY
jgi:hypothetical protein